MTVIASDQPTSPGFNVGTAFPLIVGRERKQFPLRIPQELYDVPE